MAHSTAIGTSTTSSSSVASSSAAVVGPFSVLSDDIVLNILVKLEADPRDWARVACACPRFASLVRDTCCRLRCLRRVPSLLPDLAGVGFASLHKLSVCCPGLFHAGVLLESSDFGLERDIGPDRSYSPPRPNPPPPIPPMGPMAHASNPDCWSIFDDLYLDAAYDPSESQPPALPLQEPPSPDCGPTKKRKRLGPAASHLASGTRNLSREQGNKLLASRFRGDSLYICDWPGCVHVEEKRSYMLFRGVFKDFKRSGVWRAITDCGDRGRIGLQCAFCACNETWDLHSVFCLRRVFGFHDDGEPVVRAYVCENGHVSGAWTERPMYT